MIPPAASTTPSIQRLSTPVRAPMRMGDQEREGDDGKVDGERQRPQPQRGRLLGRRWRPFRGWCGGLPLAGGILCVLRCGASRPPGVEGWWRRVGLGGGARLHCWRALRGLVAVGGGWVIGLVSGGEPGVLVPGGYVVGRLVV